MSIGSTFASDLIALVFTAVPISNVADNASSSPITNIEIALHTGDPRSGNQTTSEAGYTSYARVAVARTTGGTLGGSGQAQNDSAITFPTATGGSSSVSWVSCGTAHTSTGKVIIAGTLDTSVTVTSGVTPQFAIAALTITLT